MHVNNEDTSLIRRHPDDDHQITPDKPKAWPLFTHLLHAFDFRINTKIKISDSTNSGEALSELVQIRELHELWKQNKLVW